MAGDRIRLGAGEGGDDEGEHKILFTPYLAQCKYGNAGLIVHGAGGRFESPVPGRSESVPADNRSDTVRFTSAPCNVYSAVTTEYVKRWTGPDPVLLMLSSRHHDGVSSSAFSQSSYVTWELDVLEPEDFYEFYLEDRHFSGDELINSSLPDDVYVYLHLTPDKTVKKSDWVHPGRRYIIPSKWSKERPARGDGDVSGTLSNFYVLSVQRVKAAFPNDHDPYRSSAYGYEVSADQMIGLVQALDDNNGQGILCWDDMCPVDAAGRTIANRANSVEMPYPLPSDNPYNVSRGDAVSRAANTRAYFLLYTVREYSSSTMFGYTHVSLTYRLCAVGVEYLSWPTGTTTEAYDPRGGRHEVSRVTGIDSYGWFYRKEPRGAKKGGVYVDSAKSISVDAGYELVSPASFAGWSVDKAKSGIDDDTVWQNVQTKPDPEVPDRRYDFQVVDWGRRVVHDDAPEDN